MHDVPPGPSLEILERTLGLRTPVAVRRDRNFTHGIFFDASFRHWHAPFCFSFGDAVQSSRFTVQPDSFGSGFSRSEFLTRNRTLNPELELKSFVDPFIPATEAFGQ